MDYANQEAREIIHKWKELALVKECIAPVGSNRSNHRQDQSILSILIYQSTLWQKMATSLLGVKVHQDID